MPTSRIGTPDRWLNSEWFGALRWLVSRIRDWSNGGYRHPGRPRLHPHSRGSMRRLWTCAHLCFLRAADSSRPRSARVTPYLGGRLSFVQGWGGMGGGIAGVGGLTVALGNSWVLIFRRWQVFCPPQSPEIWVKTGVHSTQDSGSGSALPGDDWEDGHSGSWSSRGTRRMDMHRPTFPAGEPTGDKPRRRLRRRTPPLVAPAVRG